MNTSASPTVRRLYVAALLLRLSVFSLLIYWATKFPPETRPVWALTAAWLVLMISMVVRLFPSAVESMGCLKEFTSRFCPTGKSPLPEEIRQADRGALKVLLSWMALNVPILLGHAAGLVSRGFLICLSGFYGVCDLVCVLFFCPFQAWMMKNRCCTTCRVYNWDYLMICTPLLTLSGWMAKTACALAAALFIRWEAIYRLHPERFFERSNAALVCRQCVSHLCHYKHRAPAKKQPEAKKI